VPPFTKLLVANRGEIARRIIRTARAMNLSVVAVFSDPDESAPFVTEADEAVRLPGASPAETYLRAELIIDAARRTGADAVHPGYGFLAEDAAFARACTDADLVFVGPPPPVIEAMASKLRAKELMAAAGVPVLPSLVVGAGDDDGGGRLRELVLERIGLPILVKADLGGGGRGMRIVRSIDELTPAVAAAQREAASAFGDGTVFLERLVESPRHLEVQVFGDASGNVIHLFERECSLQRRHQKVIEESPSPIADDALRHELASAAVTAAKAIGYVNAGTVEFVADDEGNFWFLEINTRLQVEHPVTELVTGLDLVELQLRIAAGEPLPPEAMAAAIRGHAIEARLYAEDVPSGFLPTSGPVHRIRVPALPNVRVDSGYEDGSVVTTHYDALLAKVVAWAPTRAAAAVRLADALARAELHGVTTNRDLLVATLRHPEFVAGRIDTGFWERHDPVALGTSRLDRAGERLHVAAAAIAATHGGTGSPLPPSLPIGWRNVGGAGQPFDFEVGVRRHTVGYRPGAGLVVDGETLEAVRVHGVEADVVILEVAGVRRSFRVHHVDDTWYVDSGLGAAALREIDRFPVAATTAAAGSLRSPMPGSVVQVAVTVGDAVEPGQLLVVVEAMKMEHPVRSPHAGTVTDVLVSAGDQVEAATVLVVVQTDDEADVHE
jgi:acetyl/propionyl-CoA carboxylase alpha subunit